MARSWRRRWFWPPENVPKKAYSRRLSTLVTLLSLKRYPGKSEGLSARAIKTTATVGRRWGDGGFGHQNFFGKSAYSRRLSTQVTLLSLKRYPGIIQENWFMVVVSLLK